MEITFHRHPLFFCNIGSRNGKPPKLQWYNSTLLYYILYYMVLQKKRNVKNPRYIITSPFFRRSHTTAPLGVCRSGSFNQGGGEGTGGRLASFFRMSWALMFRFGLRTFDFQRTSSARHCELVDSLNFAAPKFRSFVSSVQLIAAFGRTSSSSF